MWLQRIPTMIQNLDSCPCLQDLPGHPYLQGYQQRRASPSSPLLSLLALALVQLSSYNAHISQLHASEIHPQCISACASESVFENGVCPNTYLSRSLAKSIWLPVAPGLSATTSATSPSPGARICSPSNSLLRPTSSDVNPLASSPGGAP